MLLHCLRSQRVPRAATGATAWARPLVSLLGRPTNVLVVWRDEAEEPVALATAVAGWRVVDHVRVVPRVGRQSRSAAFFGRGQVERLAERVKLAASAKKPLDLAAEDNMPKTSRAWRARTLDRPLALRGSNDDEIDFRDEEDVEEGLAEDDLADDPSSSLDWEPWMQELHDEAQGLLDRGNGTEDNGDERGSGTSHKDDAGAEVGVAVFVDTQSLRASQQRYLANALGVPVFDRFSVVLNIFRSRAQSKEATLRVELAALTHQRANLVDAIAKLDQQQGGDKQSRGPGERRIAIMRSRLSKRESALRKQLADAASRGDEQRRRRRVRGANAGRRLPVVALVGYTNAGKSLLQAQLSGSAGDASRAQDALFASLDTNVTNSRLADGSDALVVDTVGFVRDLSHGLVSCFHATLREALECDQIVLVVDASDERAEVQRSMVLDTLKELDVPDQLLRGRIEVHSKSDKLDADALEQWQRRYQSEDGPEHATLGQGRAPATQLAGNDDERTPMHLLVSAQTGDGLQTLSEALAWRLAQRTGRARWTLELPVSGNETAEVSATKLITARTLPFCPDRTRTQSSRQPPTCCFRSVSHTCTAIRE